MNTSSRIRDLVHSWLSKLVRGDEERVARLRCCTPVPHRPTEDAGHDAGPPHAGDR